jgi:two-component system, OmpR family, KDP operon response regulator KdpE
MPGVSNILVIDDDPGIRLYLRRRLSLAGYDVVAVEAGRAALAGLGQRRPDAIILGDLATLAAIRSMHAASGVPVLALLEGGDEARVVAALDAGADQCLPKPFAINEVMAWLRMALHRRGQILSLEGLEVDTSRGRIHRHGQEMRLSKRQRQLLRVLVEGDGAVVSYSELKRRVWGNPGARGTRYLREAIHALRQKIEADPRAPAYIVTVTRIGYRFRAKPIQPLRHDTGQTRSQRMGR